MVYLSAELHRQVPAGTTVVFDVQAQDLLSILIEFAVLHGLVVVREGGDVKVTLEKDPAAPHGMWLRTERLAAA